MKKIETRVRDVIDFKIDTRQQVNAISILLEGSMVLVGGNGGSFADGQHFVAELLGRYDGKKDPYPSIHMGSNGAELTAFGNDYGYENLFIPYIDAFRNFKPSFLFISTSGSSPNIVNAINHILTNYDNKYIVLLTGGNTTEFDMDKNVNVINVPSLNTQTIQEIHSVILHDMARDIKFNKNYMR